MKGRFLLTLALVGFIAAGFAACGDSPIDVDVPTDEIKVNVPPASVTVDAPQPQNNYYYEDAADDNSVEYPEGAFNPEKPNDNVIHGEDGEPLDYLTFNPLGAIQGAVVDGYDGFLVDDVEVYLYDPRAGEKRADTTLHGLWGFTDIYANVHWEDSGMACSGDCIGSYVLTMDLRNVVGRAYRPFQHDTVNVYWDTVGDGGGGSSSGSDPNTDTLVGYLVSGGHVLEVFQVRSVVSGSVRLNEDLTDTDVGGLQLLLIQCTEFDAGACTGDERVATVIAVNPDGTFTSEAVEEGLYYRFEVLDKGMWEFGVEGDDVDGTYYKWDTDKWFYANPGEGVPTITKTIVVKKTELIDVVPPYIVSVTPGDGYVITAAPAAIELTMNEDLAFYAPMDQIVLEDTFVMVNRVKSANDDMEQIYRNFTITCPDCADGERGYPVGREISIALDQPDFFLEGYSYRLEIDRAKLTDTSINGGNKLACPADDNCKYDVLEWVKTYGVKVIGDEPDTLFFSIAGIGDPPAINGLRVMPLTTDAVTAASGEVALKAITDVNDPLYPDVQNFLRRENYGWYAAYDMDELYLEWVEPTVSVIEYEFFTRASSGDDKVLMVLAGGDGAPVTAKEPLADGYSIALKDAVNTLEKAKYIPYDGDVADPMALYSAGRTFSVGVRGLSARGVPGEIAWVDGFGDNTPPAALIKDDPYAIRWDWTNGEVNADEAVDYLVEWYGDAAVDTKNLNFVKGLDSIDIFADADFKTYTYGEAIAILKLSEPVLAEKIVNANDAIPVGGLLTSGDPRLTGDETMPTAYKDDTTDAKIMAIAPVMADFADYARPDAGGEWLEADTEGYLTDAIAVKFDNFFMLDSGDKIPLANLGIVDEAPVGNTADAEVILTVKVAPMIKRVQVEDGATPKVYVWMTRRTACLNAANEWIDGTDRDGSGTVDDAEKLCDNFWKNPDGADGDAPFMPGTAALELKLFFNKITIDNVTGTGESMFAIEINQAELLNELDLIKVVKTKLYGHDHLGRKTALADAERRVAVLDGDDGTFMYTCTAPDAITAGGFPCTANDADADKKYYPELSGIEGAYMLTGANPATQFFGGIGTQTLPVHADEAWKGEYIIDEWGFGILANNDAFYPDWTVAASDVLINAGYAYQAGGAGARAVNDGNIYTMVIGNIAGDTEDGFEGQNVVNGFVDICLTDEMADHALTDFDFDDVLAWTEIPGAFDDGGGTACDEETGATCNEVGDNMTVGGYTNIDISFNYIGATEDGAFASLNDYADSVVCTGKEECNAWLTDEIAAADADDSATCNPDGDGLCLKNVGIASYAGDGGGGNGIHSIPCYEAIDDNGDMNDCLGVCDYGTEVCYANFGTADEGIEYVEDICGVGVPGTDDGDTPLDAIRVHFSFSLNFEDNGNDSLAEGGCNDATNGYDDNDSVTNCWYSVATITVPELKTADGDVVIAADTFTFEIGDGAEWFDDGDTAGYQYFWSY